MGQFIDLTGQRFGRLLVIERATGEGVWPIRWRCRCECGTECTPPASHLRSGATQSCGCYRRDAALAANRKHGAAGRSARSPEYDAWQNMRSRCERPAYPHYADYGGRGITVCARWRESFEAFLADMGPRPSAKHSVDRIDVNGHYEPGNVRWATQPEQCRNTRVNHLVTIDGRTQPLIAWCEERGVKAGTVYWRMAQGMSAEAAITKPVRLQRATQEATFIADRLHRASAHEGDGAWRI